MRVFVNALSTANSFGIGRYTRAMIQGLALAKPKDAQLYVYTRDPDSVMLPDPKKVIFVRPGAPGANRLLLEQGDLPRAISRARADVFISPDFTLPQICPAKKRIVTVHDMLVYTHPEGISAKARLLYRTFLPGSIRRATSILADSEYTRRSMADLFPLDAHKAKVVYPALSLEFLGAECSPPGAPLLITPPEWTDIVAVEEPFLLSVGSSSARKNTDRLAAVFCEWRQKTDWPGHLVLVGGDGAFHRPKSRIWDVGFQDDRTLRTFYYRAAGLIMISDAEGFGYPVAEALSCGCPAIVTRASSMSEVSEGGRGVVEVNPDSAESLGAGLSELVGKNGDLRRQIDSDAVALRFHPMKMGEAIFEIAQNGPVISGD